MVSQLEIEYIEEMLSNGRCDGITAHRAITALKTQQREIKQLNEQLLNAQRECKRLRG